MTDDWQPIETAPKDGTAIDLNGPHESYPMRGKWDGREWVAERMTYRLAPATFIPDPTHWRS